VNEIKKIIAALACMWLLAGCSGRSHVLGRAPAHSPSATVKTLSNVSGSVTLRGVMIEKCPVAGCWFKLRDATGVVTVDTKASGFVVLDVPLNSEVTVTGKPTRSGELQLAASGLRY